MKKFLLVGSGENYFSRIVSEDNLSDEIDAALYGRIEDVPADHKGDYADILNDDDCWHHDHDFGRTRWTVEVGETDKLELFLITQPTDNQNDQGIIP